MQWEKEIQSYQCSAWVDYDLLRKIYKIIKRWDKYIEQYKKFVKNQNKAMQYVQKYYQESDKM